MRTKIKDEWLADYKEARLSTPPMTSLDARKHALKKAQERGEPVDYGNFPASEGFDRLLKLRYGWDGAKKTNPLGTWMPQGVVAPTDMEEKALALGAQLSTIANLLMDVMDEVGSMQTSLLMLQSDIRKNSIANTQQENPIKMPSSIA